MKPYLLFVYTVFAPFDLRLPNSILFNNWNISILWYLAWNYNLQLCLLGNLLLNALDSIFLYELSHISLLPHFNTCRDGWTTMALLKLLLMLQMWAFSARGNFHYLRFDAGLLGYFDSLDCLLVSLLLLWCILYSLK